MRPADSSDLWWKSAIIYNLNVQTFLDWNDDGVGDFEGVTHRLDYLASLGVTCIWLAPFYPSPRRDSGYDISDYYGVDPKYGHLGDFVDFVRTAKDRGLRVIIDLVVNHTSIQHDWFKKSRASMSNPYRDYYSWTDDPSIDTSENMFPDAEDGVWTLDDRTRQYYRHSFYAEQPDLNIKSARVRAEIAQVMGFWLALGIDGFRVDAVPHAITVGNGDREHEYLRNLRLGMSRRQGTAIMLGEVNLPYSEQLKFYGDADGDELTMQFDFVANQHLYLSLARKDATPLADALKSRPEISIHNQWANFVRNHDELTLDQLTESELAEVLEALAPEEQMRIHGRGIVRRLPGMLEGDPRRIRMVYSLIFSLPGTPVLYYGEEIGMGEDVNAADRDGVRTPMQWDSSKNGGFSHAAPSKLPLPLVSGGYAPEHINVASQLRDPESLLSFINSLTRAYRASPEIGWGEFTVLDQPHQCILAHSMCGDYGELIALHNFAAEGRSVDISISDTDDQTRIVDMMSQTDISCGEDGEVRINVAGYGYQWLRVIRAGEKRLA